MIGSTNYLSSGTWTNQGTDFGTKKTTYTGKGDNEIIAVNQEGAIDQWVEISTKLRPVINQFSGELEPIFLLALGTIVRGVGFSEQGINNGGVIYVDSVSFEETAVDTCGLTIPSPQYTATNSTGNNDGRIEVLVSKPGSTLEYKLDSVVENRPYQSGNIFLGLEGGFSYDITVRVDGSCEYLIPGISIQTVQPIPPAPLVVTEMPNRHQRNVPCDLREYEPVFYPGERYSNMVNSTQPLEGVALVEDDLKLSIIDLFGNLVADDIAVITLYDNDGEDARVAYDIEVFPSIRDGRYRFVLYEDTGQKLYLVSNVHKVSSNKEFIIEETVRLVYTHTAEIYKFGYDELPEFKIRQRIQVNATAYQYPFDAEEYEEVSTGLSYNPRFDVDAVVEVETELYDEKAHRAFAAFLAHNSKVMNEKVYVVDGGSSYEQDRDKNSRLWNGSVRMVEQDFSSINKQ